MELALLFFETPRGLRLNVSALSSPHSECSYELGSVGLLHGSLSYLYSSLPIRQRSKSSKIGLSDVIQGYRHVQDLYDSKEERHSDLVPTTGMRRNRKCPYCRTTKHMGRIH